MKKLLYIMAAVAMTLTACNKETDTTEQGTKGTPLAIDVAVVSPTNPDNPVNSASPSTRATDTGYDTAFGVGDAIGIWVYDGATLKHSNLKWTYNGTKWAPATAADGIYYNGTAMTIKAYFPYVTGLSALPMAVTFTVQADQSTLANYRASDLLLSTDQTWGGTAATLPLSFAHAMAMVEAVPSSTSDLESVTMAAETSDGAVTEITLCPMGDGTYRALLPAQDLETSLFFDYATESYAYSATTTVEGGSYYKYGVTTLPAAVGDYYYNDGSYSATLNTAKTCIGIVFRAKTATESGLVVSLNEETNEATNRMKWSTKYEETLATDEKDGAANMTTITTFDGSWKTNYPAFAWCAAYGAGTEFAGQWYLPAKYEIKNLCASYNGLDYSEITGWDEAIYMPDFFTAECEAARETFNAKLTAAGGTQLSAENYWSSSEVSDYVWRFEFNGGYTDHGNKGNMHRVRAVLAF